MKTAADLWINVGDDRGLQTVYESNRDTQTVRRVPLTGELQVPAIGKVLPAGQESVATAMANRDGAAFDRSR